MTPPAVSLLKRQFKVGTLLLDDPAPDASPEEAIQYYAAAYPFLTAATLDEGVVQGDAMIYTAQRPPAHTKGVGPARDTAAREPVPAPAEADREFLAHASGQTV